MKPVVLPGPLRFEAVFRTEELAEKYNTWNLERDGATVQWESADMVEGFDTLNKLTFFPKRIYPFRVPVTFFMRSVFRIRNNHFAPSANREGAAR